jgi:hydrogenase maturation protein HypF
VRTFRTSSVGRLFDAVAAVTGFTRPISYEGQAAAWLEELAGESSTTEEIALTWTSTELDWRVALSRVISARRGGTAPADIARMFHRGLARATAGLALELARVHRADAIVPSGGVFQNSLLLADLLACLSNSRLHVWTNAAVPPNDGGVSLGQAALAAVQT